MNPREVRDLCLSSGVMVSRSGDRIKLTAVVDPPEVPSWLVALCREHKPAILLLLQYEEAADMMLLDSARRIGAAWLPGCHLDAPEWDAHERVLHAAYWSGNLDRLEDALKHREDYALSLFGAHRDEVQR